MSDDLTQNADPVAGTKEPGTFGQPDPAGQPGGVNQGTTPALTEEQQRIQRARMAKGDAVDDNAASHQGGMGAQSGQADYGSAGNLAGGLAQS